MQASIPKKSILEKRGLARDQLEKDKQWKVTIL